MNDASGAKPSSQPVAKPKGEPRTAEHWVLSDEAYEKLLLEAVAQEDGGESPPNLRLDGRLSAPQKPAPDEPENAPSAQASAPAAVKTEPAGSVPTAEVKSAPAAAAPSAAQDSAGAASAADAGTFALSAASVNPGWLAAFGLAALGMAGGGGGGSSGGGSGGGSSTPDPTPDTTAPAVPVIQVISTDDRINAAEKSAGVTVSGTAEAGATVGVTLGGVTRTATATSGTWSVIFTSGELPADGTFTLSAVASDAANNASTAATRTVIVDTVAPQIVSMSASSLNQTVTLTYDGTLDASNPPAAGAFSVSIGGVANAVSGVVVSGSTVTLSLANAFASGMVSVSYTDPAGDAASAIQDAAGNDAASFTSGVASDGYVRGATVYVDSNGNGVAEAGVDYLVGTTDDDGNFFVPAGAPAGAIIALGGVNIDTGVANTVPLMAPAGSTVINPLTTLVQSLVASAGGALTVSAAASSVAQALGLSLPGGQSLVNFDPIAANNPSVQRVAAQVASVVALAANGDATAATTVIGNLAAEISAAQGTLDLADAAVLANALDGVSVSLATQSMIADLANALAGAGSLTAITAAQAQFLDALAPLAPTVSIAALTADTTPNLTVSFNTTALNGTAAVANDTLVVFDQGVQIASRTLDAADIALGSVTLTLPVLSRGGHSLTATLIDQAGNASAASSAAAVTVDDVAPLAPVMGTVAQDDIIGAAEQTTGISGAAEANTTLSLQLGAVTRSVAVSAQGTWSYTLTAADLTALGQGSVTLSATATDAAGNLSAAGTRTINIDTVAPTATATFTTVTDNVGAVTGNVAAGGTTDDNTLVLAGSVSAALGAGESLIVFDGATRLGSATVSGTTWSFSTFALANGAHSFTLRVEDAAGNSGPVSAERVVTVNASLPEASASITAAVDDVAGGTGALPSGAPSNDPSLLLQGAITGTLADDDVVVIYDGATRLGEAIPSEGSWSFQTSSLASGAHAFVAVVENAAGNQGEASSLFEVTIDASAPASPSVAVVASDDVINAEETASLITGFAEADSTVTLTLGSGPTRQVSANASGIWSYTLVEDDLTAMGQGAQTVSITATDEAGNVSAAATRTVTVDTMAPDVPSFDTVAGDDEINAAEAEALILSGTTSAGARVDLSLGSNVRSVTADGAGVWSYTVSAADFVSLGQGAKTLSAVAIDEAGNISGAGTRPVSIDTLAPRLSPVSLLSGQRTNDTTPSIQFTAEAGVSLEVNWGAGAGWQSLSSATGAVQTFTAPAYTSDGGYTVSVRATDSADNVGVRSFGFELDATAPDAPVINTVAVDDLVNATEKAAGVVVSGTAEQGAVVVVTLGATTRTVVAASGEWSVQFGAADIPADGPTVVSAVATDSFGNASAPGTRGVTVDTAAPAAPGISPVEGDDLLNASECADGLTVTGTADEDGTVTLTLGSVQGVAVVVSGAWSYTFDVSELPADGVATLSARLADAAGNQSALANRIVTLDTVAPAAASIDIIATDGVVNSDEKTAGVQIVGNGAEAGATVLLTWGVTNKSVTVDDAGAWSATFSSDEVPPDGDTTILAVVQDAAGNPSEEVGVAVSIDSMAPAAPSIDVVSDDDVVNAAAKAEGIYLSGTVSDAVEVLVTWGGVTHTVAADSGAWADYFSAEEVPGDGTVSVQVVARDAAGNTSSAGTRSVLIDATAPGAPVIADNLAGDGIINAAELSQPFVVAGTAAAGVIVSVELNGVTETTTATGGTWSVSFDISALAGDAQYTLSAVAVDAAGNSSETTVRDISVDAFAPGAPGIDTIAEDDIVSSMEKNAGVTVSGTAEDGTQISVSVAGGGNPHCGDCRRGVVGCF